MCLSGGVRVCGSEYRYDRGNQGQKKAAADRQAEKVRLHKEKYSKAAGYAQGCENTKYVEGSDESKG